MKFVSMLSMGLACSLLLSGCGKNKSTPWDHDVKDPLVNSNPTQDAHGAISTAYCQVAPNGPYSTMVNGSAVTYSDAIHTSNGHNDAGDYDFGLGGACVNRPIREVLAADQNFGFFHWDGTTSYDQTEADSPDPLTRHYSYHYHVSNPFPLPSVDWTMEYYYSVVKGTMEAPIQVVISYKKVEGTKYISFWEGSVTLDYISDTLTSVTATDHINATRQGPSDSESTVKDVINKSRNQQPNWDAVGGQNPSAPNPAAPAPAPGDGKSLLPPATALCRPQTNGAYEAEFNGVKIHYGDAVTTSKGHDKKDGYDFGLGGGCVDRPLREVWAALQSQNSFRWSKASNFTVNDAPATHGMVKTYDANYTVRNFLPFLDVSWAMEWDYAVTKGTEAAPQQITITYKKTEGSSHIKLWDGTIVLDSLAEKITAISVADHLNASFQNAGTAESNVKELVNKARTEAANWDAVGGEVPAKN